MAKMCQLHGCMKSLPTTVIKEYEKGVVVRCGKKPPNVVKFHSQPQLKQNMLLLMDELKGKC